MLLRAAGATVGKRLRVERGFQFKAPIHSGIVLGNDVLFGPGCIIDAPGNLTIGSNVAFTAWTYISAAKSVTIGSNTIMGERVSIRDGNHGIELGKLVVDQPMNADPITIGVDVWLGAGVVVLAGTSIGDSVVGAANAVLRGKIESGSIVAGVPGRTIGNRHATPKAVM
jgi:acetyltransferase-like isoleucine patch superfamily enzyme